MKGNYLEADKLIDCLKAVINQQKIPQNDVVLNWELFYKTADYHHVSNMVYYAVLGVSPALPQEWAGRFSARYRKAVISEEQYSNLVEAVLWNCEQQEIHIMALDGWIYRRFYPIPEMRLMEKAEFWVEAKKKAEIDRMMYRLDFIPEVSRVPGQYSYTRSGLRLVFYERMRYGSRKLDRYFRIPIKILPREKDREYVHKMEEPDLFIFLMCNKAQRFTEGEFDLRDTIDFWLYYRAVVRGSGWKLVIKRLTGLKVWKFVKYMIELTQVWFGGGSPGENQPLLEELEKYILYKGTQGQETAKRILPLLRQTLRRKRKIRKRETRKKWRRWMFPEQEYMKFIYPRMGKYKILLPVCWLRRLGRGLFSYVRMKHKNRRNSRGVS